MNYVNQLLVIQYFATLVVITVTNAPQERRAVTRV